LYDKNKSGETLQVAQAQSDNMTIQRDSLKILYDDAVVFDENWPDLAAQDWRPARLLSSGVTPEAHQAATTKTRPTITSNAISHHDPSGRGKSARTAKTAAAIVSKPAAITAARPPPLPAIQGSSHQALCVAMPRASPNAARLDGR
jgi:hypothetical protein